MVAFRTFGHGCSQRTYSLLEAWTNVQAIRASFGGPGKMDHLLVAGTRILNLCGTFCVFGVGLEHIVLAEILDPDSVCSASLYVLYGHP